MAAVVQVRKGFILNMSEDCSLFVAIHKSSPFTLRCSRRCITTTPSHRSRPIACQITMSTTRVRSPVMRLLARLVVSCTLSKLVESLIAHYWALDLPQPRIHLTSPEPAKGYSAGLVVHCAAAAVIMGGIRCFKSCRKTLDGVLLGLARLQARAAWGWDVEGYGRDVEMERSLQDLVRTLRY